MRIASEAAHRALAYVAAVRRQGFRITESELDAYIEGEGRKSAMTEALYAPVTTIFRLSEPETVAAWLARLDWMVITDAGVDVTDLGKAVLRELDEQEVDAEKVLRLTLDPKDPLSYARAIGRIAELGAALLVDPYFSLDQLMDIVERTSITRLLIGPKYAAPLAVAMKKVTVGRDFEIRVSKELHDRYVIPANGSVDAIGTSLSGVGKRFTLMAEFQPPIADTIRDTHERLWREADRQWPSHEAAAG